VKREGRVAGGEREVWEKEEKEGGVAGEGWGMGGGER